MVVEAKPAATSLHIVPRIRVPFNIAHLQFRQPAMYGESNRQKRSRSNGLLVYAHQVDDAGGFTPDCQREEGPHP